MYRLVHSLRMKARTLVGLIGRNIGGSLSPALHEDAFVAAGMVGHYHLMDVSVLQGRSLRQLLTAARTAGFAGVNVTLGKAKFKREPGMSKLARLKTLKISVLNSRFVVSVNLKRLLKMRSNWRKFGPRRKFLGTLPKAPGAGVVKAAGFKMSRSLVR